MNYYHPVANADEPITAPAAQVVACPACTAQLAFHRSYAPRIDECGFESYSLTCKECGAPLAGIVDPFDETLLLTKIAV